jgi:peroxiredoxin (alkyl hydroperoxide reductase subunit C)
MLDVLRERESIALSTAKEVPMSESTEKSVRVGEVVPDFTMTTFDAAAGKFGKFDLAGQRAAKRWTVLFFYPADFTFV